MATALEEGAPRRTLPPMILLAFVISMLALHAILPLARWIGSPLRWLGAGLIAAALVVVLGVARSFAARGTTIKPFQVSDALVLDGPFRWSRNPIYLAMTVGLFGLAVLLGTLGPLLLVPVFPWIITRRFIVHEEAMLEERFGDAYREYSSRVRRWI